MMRSLHCSAFSTSQHAGNMQNAKWRAKQDDEKREERKGLKHVVQCQEKRKRRAREKQCIDVTFMTLSLLHWRLNGFNATFQHSFHMQTDELDERLMRREKSHESHSFYANSNESHAGELAQLLGNIPQTWTFFS